MLFSFSYFYPSSLSCSVLVKLAGILPSIEERVVQKIKIALYQVFKCGSFGSCFLAIPDSDCLKTCQIYNVFAKIFPGGFAPLTPHRGCAPRPLPQLARRRRRRLARTQTGGFFSPADGGNFLFGR